ncbi:MAG: DNA-directed RNA polymerase subunit omega [Vallitaleaceae bacterium]|nr:DNA-directed RNA polymerase subunit omega [Vallitaleaceae bacterium]
MLHPSYSDLMSVINARNEEDEIKVKSRYSVIIATSKRARQIVDGDDPLTKMKTPKALSLAVAELYEGKIDIV